MRALLVTLGTAGDLVPLIALGKGLRGRGHDVTILGNGYYRDVARREGLEFVDLCSADEHQQRTRQRSGWTPLRAAREGGKNLLEDLPRVYDAITSYYVRGQTVVAASGLMFGARIAQEKQGLPLATLHLYPRCFRSLDDSGFWPRWVPRTLRKLYFRMADRFIDRHLGAGINAFRAKLNLPPVAPILQWWHSPQLVLGLFPDWLSQPRRDWPANTSLTGFLRYDALEPFTGEQDLEEFLSVGEPPLVFSHSSAVWDARSFFQHSVAVANLLGRRAIVLTPHIEQVPQSLPSNVRHFSFVPHSRLLPRAAALVHHGGINTACQGLAAAIPQLIVPLFLDQPDNGRRLRKLGVAEIVRPRAYHPRRVSRKLRQLLESSETAERCRYYAARISEENGVEKACHALERLHAVARKEEG
ncbi:MAG TPA: nucleotide disphospho-sugar-binding domain-containing protein [Gemmataceae bacterium]|nr:nucleotide disphospho-sugar-binding domain-containing protein [Gemmataceae bacterium]